MTRNAKQEKDRDQFLWKFCGASTYGLGFGECHVPIKRTCAISDRVLTAISGGLMYRREQNKNGGGVKKL